MKLKILALILSLSVQIYAQQEVVFTDMKEFRHNFMDELQSDPGKIDVNGLYPWQRVLWTINADDIDDIPKVPGAGQIFEENGIRYQLMHNGVKIVENCYYNVSWMTHIITALRGHHEPQEEKAFYEVLKYIPANGTMIEIGSYWAYYSLWFATRKPEARNFLIEPLLGNLDVGRRNFALNNKLGSFHLGYVQCEPDDPVRYAGAQRIIIDEFVKENQIDHVDILHADIQWAEYQMLLTCKECIKEQKIDYFFISTHDPLIHLNCKNFLLESDYHIVAEHRVEDSCSVDGLIVARRKNIVGPDYIHVNKYPFQG